MAKGTPFLIAGLMVGCALLWAEILAYSQNSLYLNDRWIVAKRHMKASVMGADEFLITREPLSGNALNLGSWYGFQEVILRPLVEPSRLRFRFKIPDQGYLVATYNRDRSGFSGVRLSRRDDTPSMGFSSTRLGEFSSKHDFAAAIRSDEWHRATIEFFGSGLRVDIDGTRVAEIPAAAPAPGQIGFRSGLNGALLDDVVLTTTDGREIRESFRNSRMLGVAAAMNLAVLVAAGVGLAMWESKRFRPNARVAWRSCGLLAFAGIVAGGPWLAFDFYVWSPRPTRVLTRLLHSAQVDPGASSGERLRFRAFETWWHGILGGEAVTLEGVFARGYPGGRFWAGPVYCPSRSKAGCEARPMASLPTLMHAEKEGVRMLFLGTSQTIGAGAEDVEGTFFARTHRALSRALAPIPLESVNASMSGANSRELLPVYRDRYLPLQPDLVVMDLGNNDGVETFEPGLTALLELNRTQGVQTVLIEEAISREDTSRTLARNHETMRALAKRYGVPTLPLHEFLSQPETADSGFLWWDYVHLSPYGQVLAARWLAPKLAPYLAAAAGHTPTAVPVSPP